MTRNLYLPDSCSWYRLNLDVSNSLQPEFLDWVATASHDIHMYIFEPQQIFQDYWLMQVRSSHGLEFENVMLFVGQQPWDDPIAHVDGPTVPLCSAINWCLGEDHQPMQWYRLPKVITRHYEDPGYYWSKDSEGVWARTRQLQTANDAVDHQQWYCSELTRIDHCLIGSTPTLVRVDQPHNIAAGRSNRTAISARFRPLNRSWSDTVLHLRDFIQPD